MKKILQMNICNVKFYIIEENYIYVYSKNENFVKMSKIILINVLKLGFI